MATDYCKKLRRLTDLAIGSKQTNLTKASISFFCPICFECNRLTQKFTARCQTSQQGKLSTYLRKNARNEIEEK